MKSLSVIWEKKNFVIAGLAIVAISMHLVLRYGGQATKIIFDLPLLITLVLGGVPLVFDLFEKSLGASVWLRFIGGDFHYHGGYFGRISGGLHCGVDALGGEALENYAVESASSVLRALAKRMPSVAHRKNNSHLVDIPIEEIKVGDTIVMFPHDICPADGVVVEGHGVMDESFLTGEPFQMRKAPGSEVISGSINGNSALTISATKLPLDSRYAKIMEVMRDAEQNRPRMRRMADKLGGDLYADCGGPGDCGGLMEWRCGAFSGGAGGGDPLPSVDCHSCGDYWFDFFGGPGARHCGEESGGAGTNRKLSDRDLRQDGNADLRSPETHGTTGDQKLFATGDFVARGQFGTLFKTPIGPGDFKCGDGTRGAD